MSSNVEHEFFCDGITEEIINALAKIRGLRVTSRTSAFYFKGKNQPIPEIGKALGVQTILEGSVRFAGKKLRVTAQLIEADQDFHFWSETWDRPMEDVFEVQDEISLLIAEKLREHLGHFEIQEHLVDLQTNNLDAYTLFLKGRYYLNKWNPEDVKQAITYFQQVLAIDPKHANSLVGLADSYSFLATTGFVSYEEGWGKCAELTQQALAINDQLPGAYYQLSNLAFFTKADYKEALEMAHKAVAINPNHIQSQQFLCFYYVIAGQKKKARLHLDLALKIDPLSQETQFFSGYLDYMLEDFDGGLKKLNACLKINPKNIPVHAVKTNIMLLLGQTDEVINYYDDLPPEIIIPGEKVGHIALAYAIKKEKATAEEYFQQLQILLKEESDFAADVFILLYYAQTGQFDQVFDWIERAIANKYALLLLRFSDPLMNPVKEDPRYLKIKAQIFPAQLRQDKKGKNTKKRLLEEADALAYKKKLLRYVEAEEVFLNPDLSLRTLAEQVNIHPNQLSWLLNDSIGQNFNEFINHYRVEVFKRLAQDPSKSHLTILGLAYESGFNSKTVFNTYFKKETGLTPSQFIKSM